jgi:UDP-glucuronate 4-epimerase
MNGQRCLVTGGAGFIGSHLVDRLLRDDNDVVILDNFDRFYDRRRKEANLRAALKSARCRLIEGDITEPDVVTAAFADCRPDVVFHLAAKAGVRPSIEDPVGYYRVNVEGTLRILEEARRTPSTRVIFASSSSVYGDHPTAPFRETDRVDDPISPYAATKKSGELLCHAYHRLFGLPVTCLRFFTVYGPRNRPDLAIAKFARLIERGQPLPFYGDGTTRRDYTFVDDVIEGVVRAAERCRGYAIYNLGNSSPVTLTELVALLGEALGRKPLLDRQPPQPGDVRQTYADVSLAARELGFAPKTPLAEGLKRYVAWLRREEAKPAGCLA